MSEENRAKELWVHIYVDGEVLVPWANIPLPIELTERVHVVVKQGEQIVAEQTVDFWREEG